MDLMNVSAALSTVTSAEPNTMSSVVGLKMLDNALDMNAVMSDELTKMMELSVNPDIGSNIDVYA